jgi:hypothetical protein
MTITYLPRSVELTCYRVKRRRRAAFHVNGDTLILLPESAGVIPISCRQVAAHGKLERALGSRDLEFPKTRSKE